MRPLDVGVVDQSHELGISRLPWRVVRREVKGFARIPRLLITLHAEGGETSPKQPLKISPTSTHRGGQISLLRCGEAMLLQKLQRPSDIPRVRREGRHHL